MFTTTGKLPHGEIIGITLLNRTKIQLQRLAFAAACLLLSTAPQSMYADDADDLSEHLLQAEAALQGNQYQEAAREYRLAAEQSDDPLIAQQATRVAC